MRTYYQTLGVPQKANSEQIRGSYRKLVKSCHPDLFPSGSTQQAEAERKIREINAAYAVLSDAKRRAAYDAKISRRSATGEPKVEYCVRCGQPTLYWEIDRERPFCNECGVIGASAAGAGAR